MATKTCHECGERFSRPRHCGHKHWAARKFCSPGCYRPDPEVRFADRIMPDQNSGCWLWTGTIKVPDGYGTIKINGAHRNAHRFSYELYVGPIPDGLCVLHKCDVPACVNPDHLFLGTDADNAADRDAKGRTAQGERNGLAKLTAEIVKAIRQSSLSTTELARQYGVSRATLGYARRGLTWRHVQ